MKAILLISPEPWHTHAVSKHHYGIQLAKLGHRVFFLNPPDSSLVDFSLSPVEDIPNLTIVRGPLVAPGLRFCPPLLRRRLEARWLTRFEHRIGLQVDTIWLFENSRFFDMRFAGRRLKIYHQVDLNQNFHTTTAAATADISFCTTDFIRTRLAPHAKRLFKIHHGTAVPQQPLALSDEQAARFLPGRIHAVYIGNLEIAYLDADLLCHTARSFPDVCFHFVGSYSKTGQLYQKMSSQKNVSWWGKVPSGLIPSILARIDVMMVAYLATSNREQLASPHKFMEYFASGKTIVSTYTDEYKDKRHLLEMVDNQSDYLAAFERVVHNLAEYNSSHRQKARIEFAMEHTYPKQLDKIFSHLRESRLDTELLEKRVP